MSEEIEFTALMECSHCGNSAPMKIHAVLSQVKEYEDPQGGFPWEEGPIHELVVCPACEDILLLRHYWHDGWDPEEFPPADVVYPRPSELPRGLPPEIRKQLEEALRVKKASPNAYGVLLGRLLELVCNDRGAKTGRLGDRLRELAARDEIPQKLVEVAEKLQELRHAGAHAFVGELTKAEIPILDSLCKAILEYIYSAPELLRETEQRLQVLRARERRMKGRR